MPEKRQIRISTTRVGGLRKLLEKYPDDAYIVCQASPDGNHWLNLPLFVSDGTNFKWDAPVIVFQMIGHGNDD